MLYRIMQVSKAWQGVIAHDKIWQGMGDRLGVVFCARLRNPRCFQFQRPQDFGNEDMYLSMVNWHKKIYPTVPENIIWAPYYSEPHKRHTPSKMEQVKDFYADVTVQAYKQHRPEVWIQIGSLDCQDILKLKQFNDAKSFAEIRRRLAIAAKVENSADDLIKWCESHADQLKKIETLDLSHSSLSIFPDIFEYLPNLKRLHLVGNHLKELPPSIGKLSELKVLILNGNQLTALPDSLKNLKNLYELSLFLNDLESLPDWIGDLNLSTLNLGRNHLTSLPSTISNLPLLYELNLEGNQLTGLPAQIGALKNLKMLNLERNPINSTDLPEGFWLLPSMESLRISDHISTNFIEHKLLADRRKRLEGEVFDF